MIVNDKRIERIKKYKQSKVRNMSSVYIEVKSRLSGRSCLDYVSPIINKHVDAVVYHQGSCQWTMSTRVTSPLRFVRGLAWVVIIYFRPG